MFAPRRVPPCFTASVDASYNFMNDTGPLAVPIPGLPSLVTSILAGVTSPVDQVLASVLATLGIRLIQGFHLSRPLPHEQATKLLAESMSADRRTPGAAPAALVA